MEDYEQLVSREIRRRLEDGTRGHQPETADVTPSRRNSMERPIAVLREAIRRLEAEGPIKPSLVEVAALHLSLTGDGEERSNALDEGVQQDVGGVGPLEQISVPVVTLEEESGRLVLIEQLVGLAQQIIRGEAVLAHKDSFRVGATAVAPADASEPTLEAAPGTHTASRGVSGAPSGAVLGGVAAALLAFVVGRFGLLPDSVAIGACAGVAVVALLQVTRRRN